MSLIGLNYYLSYDYLLPHYGLTPVRSKEFAMLNKKGLLSFLAITFTVTYSIEGVMILSGVKFTLFDTPYWAQLMVAGVMWVPSLATFITMRFITHEKFSTSLLRFGSWKPYLAAWIIIPALFILIYVITWALGLGQPDWQLKAFMDLVASTGADMSTAPSPKLIIGGVFAASLFAGVWFNSLLGFAEEWGWRGYLLPRLMPLGKVKAYLLVGVIWGLWHAPLVMVGFNYPGTPVLGLVAFLAMTTTLGIFMNELTLRYRSAVLAGWIHGLFNCQAYGIWRLVFPTVNPLVGGVSGLVGIIMLLLLGLGTVLFFRRMPGGLKEQVSD
jgi:hypothetical protein